MNLFEIIKNAPETSQLITDSIVITHSKLQQYNKILCSVSGGSDSDILIDLCQKFDDANKITYAFFDTGLEFRATKEHIDQWEQELDRIEKTVLKYKKPFFFAEVGCMSREGSGMIPNNWGLQGELRLEEQCEWYRAMFEACKKRPWLRGFALWEWAPKLPSASEAWKDDSYEICEKPVQVIIKRFYEHEAGTSLM